MPSPKWVSGESGKRGNTYVRRGTTYRAASRRRVHRREDAGRRHAAEYWGRDFAFDTAGDALRQLDMRAI